MPKNTIHCQIICALAFVFTLILSNNAFSQTIWSETFNLPNKGYWVDDAGTINSDLSDVPWKLDVADCDFASVNHYAKTVSTSGGRFEVLGSNGEVIWISEKIDISGAQLVNISLDAGETLSGNVAEKKYLKAYYRIDGEEEKPFLPEYHVAGNWSSKNLKQNALFGRDLQIIVKMNSSYAGDKVYFDNVMVEAVDSSMIFASQIHIVESPLFAFTSDTIVIAASTFNNNNDIIRDSTIHLELKSSFDKVNFMGWDDGVYYWNIVSKTDGEMAYYVVDVKGKLSPDNSSIQFFSIKDILLSENFESNDFRNWSFNNQWEVTSDGAISGTKSIKHIKQAESGISELQYSGLTFQLNEKDFLFSFKLKNGNWDPSSSNYYYLWLASQGSSVHPDGYAIGINLIGSDDFVSLWKMRNGKPEILLAKTLFDWDMGQLAEVSCMRTAKGTWVISATNLSNNESYSASAFDNEFGKIDNLRLVYNYTSTRSGELWFDDLLIVGQNAAPFIMNVSPNDNGTLNVYFNKPIDASNLSVLDFSLLGESGNTYPIQNVEVLNTKQLLLTSSPISDIQLTLSANRIRDLEGQMTPITTFDFKYVFEALVHDIIINEIMADPNPSVGLPLAEYVELYNRSTKNIQLKNWSLFVRNTKYTIPEKLIKPGEYVVLCDSTFVTGTNSDKQLLIFKRFPSLLNGGTLLKITTLKGEIIDEINYSDTWYGDKEKAKGGYSLERIDVERFCNQPGNWLASTNNTGGTPGFANSIKGDNMDELAPELLGVDVVSSTKIEVVFSEPLDSVMARQLSLYSIQGNSIQQVEYQPGSLFLTLVLSQALLVNTEYTLKVNYAVDECGNVSPEMSVSFSNAVLVKNDVLINEVLFNPVTNGVDFVELYNNSGITIDLINLKLANRDDLLNLKPIYNITSRHTRFYPGTYMAITVDPDNIAENYYVPYPENLFQADRVPAYNNDKGRVVVLSDSLVVLDEFVYNETMQNRWVRDMNGVSLERLSLTKETNLSSNWKSASTTAGYATPGYENSQLDITEEQVNGIELAWDVVSPNGDGYNDELLITFLLDEPGYLANIFIFNANGAEVKRLMNNNLVGNKTKISYDARNHKGELLPMGTYLLMAELLQFDRKLQVFKVAFHVTDKY
ncbi:MAG TPA: lamin tail domain-containing protein [Prolixibacteraceae bacterium]|nr:lamin tail domain-containing protein [Prolixibacteraceae bacterium]